jgi:hypothetical protein
VDAFLPRVKRRPVLAHPSGPEDLRALLRRVDTPGYAAAVTEGQADQVLKRGHVVPVRVSSSPALPFCAFSVDPTVNGVRMVWQEDDQGGIRAMRLYPLEVDQLATLFPGEEVLRRLRHPEHVAGYGAFRLDDLVRGEVFLTAGGDVGQVAGKRSRDSGQVEVLLDAGTIHARTVLWDAPTRVFGTSLEQGRRIRRRAAERRRRAMRKRPRPEA